jgi:hypothetical protein
LGAEPAGDPTGRTGRIPIVALLGPVGVAVFSRRRREQLQGELTGEFHQVAVAEFGCCVGDPAEQSRRERMPTSLAWSTTQT